MENQENVVSADAVESTGQKYVNLIVEKDGKNFVLLIPDGSKVGETYDACFQMLQRIIDIAQDALNKSKPMEPVVEVVNNPDN